MELLNLSPFDYAKYYSKPAGYPWHMDDVHIQMLYEVISALPDGARLVEIGSHRGRSTTAFLQALKDDPTKTLDIIEIKPTPELLRMISESGVADRVIVHDYPSDQSMPVGVDLVLIDGDHGQGALVDMIAVLLSGAGIIAMHDSQTAAYTKIPGCEGAHLAANMLKSDSRTRLYLEDAVKRTGTMTERGFLVSVPQDRWNANGLVADTPWEALIEGILRGWKSKPQPTTT